VPPQPTRPARLGDAARSQHRSGDIKLKLPQRKSGPITADRHLREAVRLRDDADVVKQMRKLGGTDPRLLNDPDMLTLVLPSFRNDVRALEQYRRGPGVRISGPIVVMTAVDDPATTVEDAMAWHEHTTAGGATHTLDGGHLFLPGTAR